MATTYTNGSGHEITIEQNDDGSFSVRDDSGNNRDYGADVAANIYQDWDLRGVDLSEENLPDETDGYDRDDEDERDEGDPGEEGED